MGEINWQERYRTLGRHERRVTLAQRKWLIIGIGVAGGVIGALVGPTWALRVAFALGALIVAAGIITAVSAASAYGRARRQTLAEWAEHNGLALLDHTPALPALPLLSEGENRQVIEAMQGTYRGRATLICNYTYETTDRDSDGNTQVRQHPFTLLMMQHPIGTRGLRLRPRALGGFGRGIGDRLGSMFSDRQAVAVENDAFAKRYSLMINDDDPAHMAFYLFPPNLQEAFVSGHVFAEAFATVESSDTIAMVAWEEHSGPGELARLEGRMGEMAALLDRWAAPSQA